MANATYDLLDSADLGGVQSISFTGIPTIDANGNSYKHLILELDLQTASVTSAGVRLNNDTGGNYKRYAFYYDYQQRALTGSNVLWPVSQGVSSADVRVLSVYNIMDYTTTRYKTFVGNRVSSDSGAPMPELGGGIWQSTSTVSSLQVFNTSAVNWDTGSAARLFGVIA